MSTGLPTRPSPVDWSFDLSYALPRSDRSAAAKMWHRVASLSIICVAVAGWTRAANAQEVGRLYAKRPPSGSAFVRVARESPMQPDALVEMNGASLPIEKTEVASRYRVVRAGTPIILVIKDAAVSESVTPQPDRFYTIALARDGSSHVIDEGQGRATDLKAELRFFNLMGACKASLKIAGGPTVFDEIEPRNLKSRAINPVEAELEASCGENHASFKLPPLRSGDHYSLFYADVGGTSSLTGQFDEIEP